VRSGQRDARGKRPGCETSLRPFAVQELDEKDFIRFRFSLACCSLPFSTKSWADAQLDSINSSNNCNPGGKSDDWRNRPSGDRMSVSDLKKVPTTAGFNRPMQPRARTQAAATVRGRVAKRSATNRLRGQVGRASSGAQAGEKKFRRRFPWPTVQDYS
jgi:hypothetical protein